MDQFRADLHIHSRFSRATSKALNPRLLAAWARVKGLDVIGTGDFTHPEWLAELREQAEPDEATGLLRLRNPKSLDRELPELAGYPLPGRTLFMLQGEISSIYKKHGKVRKVHNLVFMPSFEAAERFNRRLAEVGNLASDGRPILGLDSRNLLEMVLETDPLAFLVPAHVWTPWFSLFGSKSGFDSIEECFGDLSPEIFALETGLSSDPEMNRLWSALDRFRLISNSDAHSGEKLGREANLFSGDISYEGMLGALRGTAVGHRFLGTVEFFPEEGKYHLDGHRKCDVVLEPRETMARNGACPVCGKPLTVGVLSRVLALADRDAPAQPPGQPGFVSLVPLPELISEVVGAGPGTKKVKELYYRLVVRLGPELAILQDAPLDDVKRLSAPLAEGIGRMRRGEVFKKPGYDGEYGVISVFTEQERAELKQGRFLAGFSAERDRSRADRSRPLPLLGGEAGPGDRAQGQELNPAQQEAARGGSGPMLVKAGPGTGKTHTLMARVKALLDQGESPRHILAVTFTRRAAKELEERLVAMLGENAVLPRADTLHSLAFEYLQEAFTEPPVLLSEESARRVFEQASPGREPQEYKAAWESINLRREQRREQDEQYRDLHHAYVKTKDSWNLADYSDLLELWLEKIRDNIYTCPWTQVLVDEVQDLSTLQLDLVRSLTPETGEGLFAIGDPNQAIYGFRGGLVRVEEALKEHWPHLDVVELTDNYRSAQVLLDLSARLFPEAAPLTAVSGLEGTIKLFEAPSAEGEASWIGERVRELLGATSHSLADQGDEGPLAGTFSPGDVAVLVRLKALIAPIRRTLERLGVPCAAPEAEAFWLDPRVGMILSAAGAFLGLAPDPEAETVSCPDKVLLKGPLGVSAYLQDMPPFDRLFWESRAFKQLVKAYDALGGWAELFNWINLQTDLELVRRRSEKVQVMTLHAAKGLEFRAVFLPALEDGIVPFAGPGFLTGKALHAPDRPDVDEERRLLYVGMTRAKEALYLSRARKRSLYGREMRLKESRFLEALPQEALARSTLVAKTKRKEQQLPLL